MQITKLIICGVDICYIAHPHMINIINGEILYKIWILKIDVIRVGRMVRLARRNYEFPPYLTADPLEERGVDSLHTAKRMKEMRRATRRCRLADGATAKNIWRNSIPRKRRKERANGDSVHRTPQAEVGRADYPHSMRAQ